MLKTTALIFISAILCALPFCNGALWVLAWVGYVPLFFALENKKPLQGFFIAYLAGVIFWSVVVYWLIHVTLLGVILLILYLSFYFGLFGFLAARLCSLRGRLRAMIVIPSLWVIFEYLRAHLLTGFGWAFLGYSQYLNLPAAQIADIAGPYGVSFLVMIINVFIFTVVGHLLRLRRNKQEPALAGGAYLVPLIVLAVSLIYGFYQLRATPPAASAAIKLSVIQANIPQEFKWNSLAQEYIVKRYERLSEQAAKDSPDAIVWPESASPGFLGEDGWVFDRFFALAEKTATPILTGTVIVDRGSYFNSAVLIDKKGAIRGRYDKLHLVPFGEYVPLKKILPFLGTVVQIGDFTPGKEYTLIRQSSALSLQPVNLGVLICFEDTIPELARNFVNKGAQVLVNITNDAWYKDTTAPYQHLSASVFRAIETRTSLARAANTGVSCFIDSAGRIISRVARGDRDTFIRGFATQALALNIKKSIYCVVGDLFVLCCALFCVYGIMWFCRK